MSAWDEKLKSVKENIKKRGRSYEQNISDDYLMKIQTTYFDFIKQLNNQRIVIVDVNRLDFVNIESDFKLLKSSLNEPYQVGITRISL